jgi:hypothetical protein
MNKEIKEITEIITRLQGCGRKGISPDCAVIVYNKDIATALYAAGYRKRSETVKEFAEKALALCCKHHYSIATRNNQQGMGMFTEGFEQVLSETAADLAEQYGKEE